MEYPTSRLRYFEVWKDVTGATQMRNGVVLYNEFEDWLMLKSNYSIKLSDGDSITPAKVILRLITCENPGQPFALGCSQSFFDRLREEFQLHGTTQEAFLNNNGAFARHFARNGTSEVERMSLVMRVPRWVKGCEALSLCYNHRRETMRAFLHWINDEDHLQLVNFLRRLEDSSRYRHPLLLPVYMLQKHRRQTELYRQEIDDSILNIEFKIGYALPGMLFYKPSLKRNHSAATEGQGLEDIVRRQHASLTELLALVLEASFGKEFGTFLRKTEQKLVEYSAIPSGERSIRVCEGLVDQIKFDTNLYSNMLAQLESLRGRIQSQINLSFSLIAQEENKLSRAVAENSKRDSAAMKTIAVVTMLFLPPTFVATLFSMSMFNWGAEESKSHLTSAHFWIYWAVAVPLTFVVWLIWRIWWRMEERKHTDKLCRPKQG